MLQMLDDGTVISSVLSMINIGDLEDLGHRNNLPLRLGYVRELILPDSPRSVSKKYVEYRVAMEQSDGGQTSAEVEYGNCIVLNLFGGKADKFQYTLRKGSQVAVLCVNGFSNRAYILGGIRDTTSDAEADGHSLLWEFNGVKATVNKDGEFTLLFQGATQETGELAEGASATNSGTQITMKKNGDLEFKHDGESVLLDHANKRWEMLSDGKIELAAQNEFNATGQAAANINTSGTATISAAKVRVGGALAVDALVKGTTYRAAETVKHTTVSTGLKTAIGGLAALASLLAGAGGALQAVSVMHKVPVAGPIAGSVPLQAAATALLSCLGALTTAVGGLTAAVAAIDAFEAGSLPYLSPKNTTD